MIKGILFSIIAGLMISLQGIFNTRISEKIGFNQTTAFVKGTAFLFALILLLPTKKINFSNIIQVNKIYLLAGVLGTLIVFGVMKGISCLGASYAITIIIVTQILTNFTINLFGLFGENLVQVNLSKVLGLILMICGVLLFQFSSQ